MNYFIASDHAGFALKSTIVFRLGKKFSFSDLGVFTDERVDYPKIAVDLARKVASEKDALGVLLCGTGVGMSIVANKVKGARAAVIYDGFTAKMARQHNNANIACLGARNLTDQTAVSLVKTFLETGFLGKKKGEERHLERINQIQEIEKKHFK